MRTGSRLEDSVFKTKIDFWSGLQSKESHGHPRGHSFYEMHNSLYFTIEENILSLTWQGHFPYCALKVATHELSHP